MGMALGNLGGFIQNYQQAQQMAARQRQQQQQQRALAALGNYLSSGGAGGGSTPTNPNPNTPPVPAPQPAAQGGGQPIQVQNPAQLTPQAQAGLAAVNNDGGTAPPPQAQPAPQPTPNLSAPAQPQGVDMDDPVAAGQQTIKAMAAAIKAANPGIDGRTLALATQAQIEDIKGISPLTKAAMTSQMKNIELQQRWQLGQQKLAAEQDYHAGQLQALAQRGATQQQIADERDRHDRAIEGIQRESIGERLEAAQIGAQSREQVANIGANSRETVADTNADSREGIAEQNTDERREHGHAQTYASVYGSLVRGGTDPKVAAAAANAAVQSAYAGGSAQRSGGGTRQARPARTGRPAAAPASRPGAAPKPGTVMNGYRFKGGDPSVQGNWTKVS